MALPRTRDRRASRRVVRLHEAGAAAATSGHCSYSTGVHGIGRSHRRDVPSGTRRKVGGRLGEILETRQGTPAKQSEIPEELGGVYGTRTRGLRRDRQRSGCSSDWQLLATVWNNWKSIHGQHRPLARFGRTFQSASYT